MSEELTDVLSISSKRHKKKHLSIHFLSPNIKPKQSKAHANIHCDIKSKRRQYWTQVSVRRASVPHRSKGDLMQVIKSGATFENPSLSYTIGSYLLRQKKHSTKSHTEKAFNKILEGKE